MGGVEGFSPPPPPISGKLESMQDPELAPTRFNQRFEYVEFAFESGMQWYRKAGESVWNKYLG